MRKSVIFVLLAASSGWLIAEEPTKPVKAPVDPFDKSATSGTVGEGDLGEQVRHLIRELDASQKSRREEAEKNLVALGVKALDYLPENTDRLSAEAGQRLDRVREKLEKNAAESSLEPTAVTLSGKTPLSEVLAAIEEQTGNKIVDLRKEFGEDVGDPDLKVEFKQTPFWPALDQVLDDADLTIYPYASEQGGLGITSRGESRLPRHGSAIYSGAFRIEGTMFIAQRDLRDPMSHKLELTLEAAWEPRLRPIVITQPSSSVVAVDDQGQPVPVAPSAGDMQFPIDGEQKSVDMPIQFELTDRNITRIASLKGKLIAMLPGRIETFRFTNLDKTKRVDRK
ncbi:MAG TPA: hypothetical protein VFI31_28250, partial [Pirellulales bacterium]|nr:hypothetical protein [Pirellulales bacterium]